LPRSKLEILRYIFTSEYWLIASLGGAFFSFFALNRGGVVVFIDASFVFLMINFLAGTYRLKTIPHSYWFVTAICAYLLVASVLFHFMISHYRWMANLVRMLCVVFAVHCLSQKRLKQWLWTSMLAVPSLAICWQFFNYYYYKVPFGTFTNPHYLANFSMLALPIIFGSFLLTKGWCRFLFLVIALLDINLLIILGSRPAIVGVTFGAIFVMLFLTKGRTKWFGLLLFSAVLFFLYFSRYGDVYFRFKQLIINLPQEERVQLWFSAWNALKDNSWLGWVIGNGIGGYRKVYLQYTPPQLKDYFFPHFHLLEILYENGIIGALLVFGGIGALLLSSIRRSINAVNKNRRTLIKCLVVALLSWMIHSGLTFPFYSKYSLYSLAFILGPLLAALEYSIGAENEADTSQQKIDLPDKCNVTSP
jgi:O-antigen ligase